MVNLNLCTIRTLLINLPLSFLFPLSSPRGGFTLRRLHHLRLSMRSPLTTSFIAFRPRTDEVLEPPE